MVKQVEIGKKKQVNFFVQTHINLMSILYLALSYVVELLQFSFTYIPVAPCSLIVFPALLSPLNTPYP